MKILGSFPFYKGVAMQGGNLYSSSEGNIEVSVIYCLDYHHKVEFKIYFKI